MASRQDTEAKKAALASHLRAICEQRAVAGGSLPPLRQLAEEFGLSLKSTHLVLRVLQDEGLVTSTRGGGTAIVVRSFAEDEFFARVEPNSQFGPGPRPNEPSFVGFSNRMAELGAFVVEVPSLEALRGLDGSGPMRCRGIFGRSWHPIENRRLLPEIDLPVVAFGEHADVSRDDAVTWDDETGGRQATEHILQHGHRDVVFVGEWGEPGHWSAERARGYRKAMQEAGLGHAARAVSWPQAFVAREEMVTFGREAAEMLAAGPLPDAVVACNDDVAIGFLEALHDLQVPLSRWPAIIGFDDELSFRGQPISSMRLDLREIGRVAAEILWDRAHGTLTGPPIQRKLPMRLIPRMTSQSAWAYRLHRLVDGFPFEVRESAPEPPLSPSSDPSSAPGHPTSHPTSP